MLVLSILFAAFIALGLACAVVSYYIAKSNDHGNKKGTIHDFSHGSFRILESNTFKKKPHF